jgi:hypothetical protein
MTDTNPSGLPNAEKMAANHIRNLIIKSVCPVLRNIQPSPDNVDDFKNDFVTVSWGHRPAGGIRSLGQTINRFKYKQLKKVKS